MIVEGGLLLHIDFYSVKKIDVRSAGGKSRSRCLKLRGAHSPKLEEPFSVSCGSALHLGFFPGFCRVMVSLSSFTHNLFLETRRIHTKREPACKLSTCIVHLLSNKLNQWTDSSKDTSPNKEPKEGYGHRRRSFAFLVQG
ncbi:hypothetical protein E2320_020894 [Naja naja]|nr:hypothetical protein E2320_020894 [Naja naja]